MITIIPITTNTLVISSFGLNFFLVISGSTNEVNSAVVDKKTKAMETFDLTMASKKQYQCKAISIPFPRNFKALFLSISTFCFLKIK